VQFTVKKSQINANPATSYPRKFIFLNVLLILSSNLSEKSFNKLISNKFNLPKNSDEEAQIGSLVNFVNKVFESRFHIFLIFTAISNNIQVYNVCVRIVLTIDFSDSKPTVGEYVGMNF